MTSAFLGLWILAAPTSGDSVYGVVRDAVTGHKLPGVAVESGALGQALTDHDGAYVVPASSPGFHRMRFARAGYEAFSVNVTLPERHSLRLDVALAPVPVTLPTISVATPPAGRAEMSGTDNMEIGLRRFTSTTLRSNPLVSSDDPLLAAVGDRVPDAQVGTLRPLRVRGGSSDQNLLLLDGLPVYASAHLGGAAGPFDPDLLGRVDLHTAVPAAASTGRLSSVLDVQLRPPDPDAARVSGAWDQVAVRQSLSTPLGTAGALQVGLRRSYRGLFPRDVNGGEFSGEFSGDANNGEQNGFGDALVHASLGGTRDRLSIYIVDGWDKLAFPALPHLPDDEVRRINAADWSYRTAGLVWGHAVGARHMATVRAWDAREEADIAWGPRGARETVASALRDQGVTVELSPRRADAPPILGFSISHLGTSYVLRSGARNSTGMAAAAPALRLTSAPVLAGVFGQGEWRLGPRWTLTVGLRANAVDPRRVLLEPRISARLEVAPNVFVLVGHSRIHQFVQSLRNEESLLDHAFGAELPLTVGAAGLRPARGDQLSGAFEARLGPGSTVRLDVYTRWLRGLLIVPGSTTGPFARAAVPSGSGSARGIELEMARRAHDLDLRLALGVEGAERHTAGEAFAPGALRSLWLTTGAGYHIDDHTAVRLASWVAGRAATTPIAGDLAWDPPGVLSVGSEIAGTPEAVGGAPNPDRLPGYWRVDAGLVRDWRVTTLGTRGVLTTAINLSNLLNARNPLGYVAGALPDALRALYFPSRTLDVRVGWHF